MSIGLWALVGLLTCIILLLGFRLFSIKKTAKEIEREFAQRLMTETNTLIDVPYRDKTMRNLADGINHQLRKLREERHKFQQGDSELKNAVTNISHDLRTPLTAICGYLDLLKEEEKSEAAARYLEQIEDRTEALKQLTEELFKYSVIASTDEIAPASIDLRQALEESLLSFYGVIKQKGLDTEISITEKKIERFLDPQGISRVFSNIINNAIKYSDGDFQVWMGDDGTITFANTAADLDSVSVAKLFDRFYTVETGRNSTGLGLSIAKLLTERMGGRIYAEYKENMLMITVSFPQSSN